MDGGDSWLLALEFFGFAGLTIALAAHQLWALKKLQLRQREKELAQAARQGASQAG
jgi:hypothetical protein